MGTSCSTLYLKDRLHDILRLGEQILVIEEVALALRLARIGHHMVDQRPITPVRAGLHQLLFQGRHFEVALVPQSKKQHQPDLIVTAHRSILQNVLNLRKVLRLAVPAGNVLL